ncbi:peptidase domain-containing ABC transporter [Ancylomarina sp. DW003]|nr:peptidase domain-containing ABC transporter [Ancylomarina sp. DW003]MDE5421042.1 peptidase domain-containing ABC transporter [Ancylomarina sp. DW003]
MKFPFFRQFDAMDCGPSCLKMIIEYYGKNIPIDEIRNMCYIKKSGVNLLGLSDASTSLGFRSVGARVSLAQLISGFQSPCILHWNHKHFVVLFKIEKRRRIFSRNDKSKFNFHIADPAHGIVVYKESEFVKYWASSVQNADVTGILMTLEPSPKFYDLESRKSALSYKYLLKYLKPHKRLILHLILGLLLSSVLQLILPFLTQAVVDKGIGYKDINFIRIILFAQIALIVSRSFVEYLRRWILLQVGARMNIALITDFIVKLVNLPMVFFDSKLTGDLIRRIEDHKRIELFLTTSVLNIAFSVLTVTIFSIVLVLYSLKIFLVFLCGSFLYFIWIKLFLKRRADLDYKNFAQTSKHQSFIIELIQTMPEIKLTGCENQKRWRWESIQTKLFRLSLKSLSLNQWQQTGGVFINEIKNVIITIVAATSVISGEISLGMMLAIQFIIGQMQGPIEQAIQFVQATQDAKLSMERLNEVHERKNEELNDKSALLPIPVKGDIRFENVKFSYDSPLSNMLLDDISLHIPFGKTTAIVGMSGSGKTTLLKLMLRFYDVNSGEIKVGNTPLNRLSFKEWRQQCGVVMQEGSIFSDTITANITPGEEQVDIDKLKHAVNAANLDDFIASLPLKYNTKIGNSGIGLSQGQKQRILIARAVYRDPQYLFFDEATNALDSTNEKIILRNLLKVFNHKTVVVVAHRLSTVKNADQIVVLKDGKIIEVGTNDQLLSCKNEYFNLVKDQLATLV